MLSLDKTKSKIGGIADKITLKNLVETIFCVKLTGDLRNHDLTVPLPSLNQAAYQGQFYIQCHSTLYITDILGYLAFNITQNSNVHFYL